MTAAKCQLPLVEETVRSVQQRWLSTGCMYVGVALIDNKTAAYNDNDLIEKTQGALKTHPPHTHTNIQHTFPPVPCNQFGGQAPGTSEEERAWAHKKFGFAFPVMVRGMPTSCGSVYA